MTLHVEFDQLIAEAKRHIKDPSFYVSRAEGKTRVSAADLQSGLIVSATPNLSVEATMRELESRGFKAGRGSWSDGVDSGSHNSSELPFIAAVAYKSRDDMPGLWVDASQDHPTHASVLRALYEEFQASGEIGSATLEEFIRAATPNVVILPPSEIEKYLNDKSPCEDMAPRDSDRANESQS